MIISGHQPAYLPWLGYFHKLSLCDIFVFMDTVQYLENDWNNRNKIRTPQGWMWLTVPIDRQKTKSNMLDDIVIKKENDFNKSWQYQHWQAIRTNYAKAKYFDLYKHELEFIYLHNYWDRLIDLCWEQLIVFKDILDIKTKLVRMTEISFEGKKDKLVLDHCLKLGGNSVVFGMNGKNYVDLSIFRKQNINVYFQNYSHPVYPQRFNGFESYMCILDLILNCGPDSLSIIMSDNATYTDLKNGLLWE